MSRRDGCEFRVLTDDDLADIHLGTLEVLERTGVFVEDEEAREIFAGAGATVDAKGVVRIPGHVVEQAVRTAPSKLRLAGRNPKNDIVLEAGRVGFTNFGEGVAIVDPYTGELQASRPSRTSPTPPRSSTRCPTSTSTSAPWWPRTSTSASCTCTSTRRG